MTAMPPIVQLETCFLQLPYELSVNQVVSMGQLGILGPTDHVEFIEGNLLRQPVHHIPHILALAILSRWLYRLLPEDWLLITQATVHLNDAAPEPDLAIATGPAGRYFGALITADELYLVIEVADTTFRFDSTTKLELYARNGIGTYWLINIPERQVHVYTTPEMASERYQQETVYRVGESVPLILAGQAVGVLAVDALFPPIEGDAR